MCELIGKDAGMPGKGSWAAVCTAIALVLGLPTLAVFSIHDVNQWNQPSDEELTTNFFSHEAGFDELAQILTMDRPPLIAEGNGGIDPAIRRLLQQLSVKDFRYFPDSGKLVLVPDDQENLPRPTITYVYLPHAPGQSLAQYRSYAWRGPGMYTLSGDRPLKGSWFIHHDMTIEIAIAPY